MNEPTGVDVSVVIVNWNTGDRLRACVRSVAHAATGVIVETIVVDNASGDGSLDGIVDAAAPLGVEVVRRDRNTGFAAACNVGLERARGRHVLLLNPDAVLVPRALEILVPALDALPTAGVVGGRVVDEAGRPEATVGRFPSLGRALSRLLGRGALPPITGEEPVAVDWVSGACLALGQPALGAGVRLDAGYPLYMEDVDLCRHVRAEGLGVLFLPRTLAVHARGGAGGGTVDLAHRRRLRRLGEARYHRKWGGATGRLLSIAYRVLARGWESGAGRLPETPRA